MLFGEIVPSAQSPYTGLALLGNVLERVAMFYGVCLDNVFCRFARRCCRLVRGCCRLYNSGITFQNDLIFCA